VAQEKAKLFLSAMFLKCFVFQTANFLYQYTNNPHIVMRCIAMEQQSKETISLGGNIELNGFQNIEGAKMIVLKKIVGNCVKQIQEKKSDYEKLAITLEGDENNAKIKAELTAGSNFTGEDTQNNIFTALDNALKKIIEQI